MSEKRKTSEIMEHQLNEDLHLIREAAKNVHLMASRLGINVFIDHVRDHVTKCDQVKVNVRPMTHRSAQIEAQKNAEDARLASEYDRTKRNPK